MRVGFFLFLAGLSLLRADVAPRLPVAIPQSVLQQSYASPRWSLVRVTYWCPQECPFGWKSAAPNPWGLCKLVPMISAAVDDTLIPYGSLLVLPGGHMLFAHDCGSAVYARQAARRSALTYGQRDALVVDICVDNPEERAFYEKNAPEYMYVKWYPPRVREQLLASFPRLP